MVSVVLSGTDEVIFFLLYFSGILCNVFTVSMSHLCDSCVLPIMLQNFSVGFEKRTTGWMKFLLVI